MSEQKSFSWDLIDNLVFHYGYKRTVQLIDSLRSYPTTYPIRVNTTLTSIDKLTTTLNEKNIPATKHPKIPDCVLIKVKGPNPIPEKSKKVTIKFSRKINDLLIGGHLGSKDFIPTEDLTIGDELTLTSPKDENLANGILMMNPSDIQEEKSGLAIKVIQSKYEIPNLIILKEYLRGHFLPQNLAEMIVGAQIKLKPKDRFLDLTVGSGEFLTHLFQNNSSLWENNNYKKKDIKIIANQRSKNRWKRCEETIKRLRLYKAKYERFDYSVWKVFHKFNRPETFDQIVINAPSTDLGIRPKIYENVRERQITKMVEIQRKYLEIASNILKRGGNLFYYTNSINPEENELNIKYAVEELGLKVIKQKIYMGESCDADFEGAKDLIYIYPDKHDAHGQFIAKLSK